jgi:hypothetical protein
MSIDHSNVGEREVTAIGSVTIGSPSGIVAGVAVAAAELVGRNIVPAQVTGVAMAAIRAASIVSPSTTSMVLVASLGILPFYGDDWPVSTGRGERVMLVVHIVMDNYSTSFSPKIG